MPLRPRALVAAAFVSFASPSQADVPPPPLAADKLYQTNTERAVFPGSVAQVRAFFDANPITDFVTPTDAIPALIGIEVLSGDWPQVGAVRRVDLDGGDRVLERVLINEPDQFTYQIWNITAPAGRFVDHIKGEFRYVPQGDSVEVIWDYNVKPAVFVARPFIASYLRRDFGPFMQAGMDGMRAAHAGK
ncbi:SRPBCC family protein [Sulfitobacter albidus]|uniref:SRPBCC family protein n=1 Tax=Sulfitobacter albidus TaxID=2829501 RepID=A0A975PLF2_9RHOB|nr:SRPBCC family protein [Sulfitobacter albidus]QUJ75306.1 SRPBCC family protein [Sulfitobacter albidus]